MITHPKTSCVDGASHQERALWDPIQPHLICKILLEPYFSFPLESDHLRYYESSSHTRTLNPLPQPSCIGDCSNSLHLNQKVTRQLPHLNRSARRLRGRQHRAIDLVHGCVVAHVGKENRCLHDIVPRCPGFFEHRGNVLNHLCLRSVSSELAIEGVEECLLFVLRCRRRLWSH
jgi:hypothetical protein